MQNPINSLFLNSETTVRMADVDWASHGVANWYVLLCTGRSGSTLLSRMLTSTGLCGSPDEFFNENYVKNIQDRNNFDNIKDYINYIIKQHSRNGIFGFKIDALRFEWISRDIGLDETFNTNSDVPLIWLTRQDVLAQALSFAHAKRTGIWHIRDDGTHIRGPTPYRDSELDDRLIWRELLEILRMEQNIENLFLEKRCFPLRITYEQLISEKSPTLARVLAKLGLPLDQIDISLKVISERPEPLLKLERDNKPMFLARFYKRHKIPLDVIMANRGRLSLDTLGKMISAWN